MVSQPWLNVVQLLEMRTKFKAREEGFIRQHQNNEKIVKDANEQMQQMIRETAQLKAQSKTLAAMHIEKHPNYKRADAAKPVEAEVAAVPAVPEAAPAAQRKYYSQPPPWG